METIYLKRDNLKKWQQMAQPNVMALGFFDGLHLGHQEVIRNAYQAAKKKQVPLSVMSFFPHPKFVLSDGKKKVNYLMPFSVKEKVLASMGVDTFYMVQFDHEFAMLSPEQFVVQYLTGLGVVHAVAGFDFTYGRRGEGNMDTLKNQSSEGFEVTKVPKVEMQGEKISSTLVREKLLSGKVDELSSYCGCDYEIECEWDGFNLKPEPYYTLPSQGRYFVTMKRQDHSYPAEIHVKEKNELTVLELVTKMDLEWEAKVSIVWHKQMRPQLKVLV